MTHGGDGDKVRVHQGRNRRTLRIDANASSKCCPNWSIADTLLQKGYRGK